MASNHDTHWKLTSSPFSPRPKECVRSIEPNRPVYKLFMQAFGLTWTTRKGIAPAIGMADNWQGRASDLLVCNANIRFTGDRVEIAPVQKPNIDLKRLRFL